MAVAFRAASGGQSSTAALTASVTKPTGTVAGDHVIVGLCVKDSQTFTAQTGWTLESNANSGGNVSTTATYRRTLDGTESWPISFAWTGSSVKFAWNAAAFSPGTGGNLVVLDGEATVKVDTTAATTHTANSKAAVAGSVCSVIVNTHRNSASGATGTTVTPPTNWTEPTNGDQTTASGTTTALSQLGVETCYRVAQSGTVTPGSATFSLSSTANVYHFLLAEIAPETSPQLEASGFGTFTGIGSGDTINSVTASVNQWSSVSPMAAPVYQLWDGTSTQIGADITGTASTSTGNTDGPSWTGVTYSQLSTLRFRIAAKQGNAAAGDTQSVDYVSLTVNYTPVGGVPQSVTSIRVPAYQIADFSSQAQFS